MHMTPLCNNCAYKNK